MAIRALNQEKTKWAIDHYPKGRKGKRERFVFIGTEAEAIAMELSVRGKYAGELPRNPRIHDAIPLFLCGPAFKYDPQSAPKSDPSKRNKAETLEG
ncbi:hypothetical protein EG832_05540 [bacterium]|nr:hypothetical protein [bacterium]